MGEQALTASAPRRVLVVAPQPFYEDRGTPIAVRQVLEALASLGYEVDLLTYPVGTEIELPGVRVFRIPNPLRIRSVPVGFSLRKLYLDALLVPAIRSRLRDGEYSYIHAVEEAAFPAVWFAARRRLPVIYDMQSSLPEQMAKHRLFRLRPVRHLLNVCERWLLGRASLVMSSTGLARQVRSAVPEAQVEEWVFSSELSASPRAEAQALREQLGISPGARVVVYTGTFEPYQGIAKLLEAIPMVCASLPETVFVLVGADAEGRAAVSVQARRLGLNGHLRLVERQPRDRIPPYLSMADLLVSPRLYGGNLPLKIFDYLAAGRPIIATDIECHRAVLSDERAVLVKPEAEDLALAIRSVLTDTELSGRLAAAASQYAIERLGRAHFVRSVEELYARVDARR